MPHTKIENSVDNSHEMTLRGCFMTRVSRYFSSRVYTKFIYDGLRLSSFGLLTHGARDITLGPRRVSSSQRIEGLRVHIQELRRRGRRRRDSRGGTFGVGLGDQRHGRG